MSIWKQQPTLALLNQVSHNTMVEHLGIEFVEIGDDYLKATMPVDHRTVQPMRLLHGGASAVLAETMGSVASMLCVDDIATQAIVGTEINASHLRSGKEGETVYGIVQPIKIGRRTHVWRIQIFSSTTDKQLCESRLSVAVIDK